MFTKSALTCINATGYHENYQHPEEFLWAKAWNDVLSHDNPMKSDNPGKITKFAGMTSSFDDNLRYCLKKCANAKTSSARKYWVKKAGDFMGGTNDQELETAIFTLSSHFIRDKAPKLFDMNYFVGFRILDASDDNTKVVGIYGFKIGKTWVYIPIFFDKGKINGFELCYIYNKDQFVPLKEGWLDWIIKNSGDKSFGQADKKDMRQIGARYPDMQQLTQPPILGKLASFEPWVQAGMLGMAKHVKAAPDMIQSAVDLEKIASSDAKVFTRLVLACDKYPIIKVAMDGFYGKDFLQKALDRLQNSYTKIARAKRAFKTETRPLKHSAVRVVTQDDTSVFPFLTEKQAAELIDGPIAIDEREDDEVSVIEEEIKFVSPHQTGVYDVFFADGLFRECLVIINPLFLKKPVNREICLVIDWKRKAYVFAKSAAVLCAAGSYKEDWFNRLPADQFRPATDMRKSENARCYCRAVVTPEGYGTCPFKATGDGGVWHLEYDDVNDTTYRDRTYDINEGTNTVINDYQAMLQADRSNSAEELLDRIVKYGLRYIICSPTLAGRKTVIRDDKLILPKIFKYIDLDYRTLALATENDIMHFLFSDRKKLRAAKTASAYIIDRAAYDKNAAFKTLVTDYHFRAKTANEILTAAELVGNRAIEIPYVEPRYKAADLPVDPIYGQGGRLTDMMDNTMSPIFPDAPIADDGYSGLPMQMGYEDIQQLGFEDQPVPPEFTQEIPPPDPMAMQQAANAAQHGYKNVFDVSVLAGLLNTNRRDEALSDYTKTFRTALDRICRLYFHYLSDKDNFIDRYGEDSIDKFEETLLDVMSSLGDLVLFILQKDDRPELTDILDSIGVDT